ncbi:hypothetical protein [Krasilnikovia sp. MM14-A1259]|uniref:hypothetical protein n=1 Tax=Krasilnikovia sp. MM14-A1259 TaxID=3373539 RepID=UPI0037FB6BDE
MFHELSHRRAVRPGTTLFALITLLAAAGCSGLTRSVWPAAAPAPQWRSAPSGPPSAPRPGQVLATPLRGRTGASLTVRDAASRVDVRLVDLPGLLYRISTPAESGLAPQVTGEPGRVCLGLRPTGGDGPDTVRIALNRTVDWDVRLPAGAGEQHLDLTGGRVRRVLAGPAGLLDLRLPRPRGTVPVTLTGGVATITVRAAAAVPVRVRLRGGAGRVTTPHGVHHDSPAGSVLTPAGWASAADRYAVDLRAPAGTLTLVSG